jgi:hypothetical protein
MRYKRFRLYVWSRTGNFSKFFDTKDQAYYYLKRKQIGRQQNAFYHGHLYDYDYKHKSEFPVGWWDSDGKWWTQQTRDVWIKEQWAIELNKYFKHLR